MKCKFEHEGDCCNCGAPQYMAKCKGICDSAIPMSNAERIRSVTDEELAKLLMETAFYDFKRVCKKSTFFGHGECDEMCVPCIVDWLQQPAETNS